MTQILLPIIGSFLLSACCGFLFIPALLRFCKQKNLYDLPSLRKVHHTMIPRLGGIAFIPSMIIAAVIVMYTMTSNTMNGKSKSAYGAWAFFSAYSWFMLQE